MKKLLLGLALGGLTLTSLAAANVNAEENFEYKQDFNYKTDAIVLSDYNIIAPTDGSKLSLVDDENEDYIRYTMQSTDLTQNSLLRFRGGSASPLYVNENDTVFKTRFRVSSLDSNTSLKTWFAKGQNVGGGTYTWLQFTSDGIVTANPGGSLPTSAKVEANTWYEFTLVIDNNDGLGTDYYYGYLDGELIYSAKSNQKHDYIGNFYELQFETAVDASATNPRTVDVDYMYFGDYNGGTATAPAAKTVKVSDEFDLMPTVTPNSAEYDLSVNDDWTPSFSQEDVLTYNAETKKFTAVGQGTVDVTFNFIDPMIASVKTTVTVEAGEEEIKVEGIELEGFANNTIDLVVGESYDLTKLFKVTNPSATNKVFTYQASGNNYTLEGNTIKATQVGESSLTVNATDGGGATLTAKVNVVSGTYVGAPTVGTEFASAGATATAGDITYQTGQYSGHTYSKVSVVDDSLYGPTFAFEGSSGAASNVLAWIDDSKLEANKNYVLTIYAKLSGRISGNSRVDLKIDGYTEVTNENGTTGYSYNSIFHKDIMVKSENFTADEWLKIEAPLINFDSARLDGLKIELVSWNTADEMTTYISHPSLVVTNEAATLDGIEATVGDVALVNVEAEAESITLTSVGATSQVNVLPIPTVADLGQVSYESSDEGVATISNTGLITAVDDGETTIKVTTAKGNYYVVVNVAIVRPLESIEVENENVTLTTDDKTFNVTLTLTPVDYTSAITVVAADPTIVNVSNESIVNGKLYISPLKAGTTTITLTSADNPEVKLTITVTVTEASPEEPEPEDKPCTGITLDKTSVTLNVGDTHTIKATLTPADTTDEVTYTSSDTKVASVDANGKVTAVAEGTATITVKCGDKTATLTVTVNAVNPAPSPDDNSNAGLIWGIVGCVIAVAVVAGVVTFVVLKKKRSNK